MAHKFQPKDETTVKRILEHHRDELKRSNLDEKDRRHHASMCKTLMYLFWDRCRNAYHAPECGLNASSCWKEN